GFTVLKVKVGIDTPEQDLKRIQAIRERVGNTVTLRSDANQGWDPKSAVRIINQMDDAGFNIELIEQPVRAHDIVGMKFVT
ncbi:enolase C-terminal domain-like protein, partial [Planococcus sp. SIMBA_143]